MSRIIKNDKPFTESEIKYLYSRGRHADIAANRKKFGNAPKESKESPKKAEEVEAPKSEEGQKLSLDSDIFERVKGLSAASLTAELKKAGLGVPETERDQRIKFAKHLQEQRDSKPA